MSKWVQFLSLMLLTAMLYNRLLNHSLTALKEKLYCCVQEAIFSPCDSISSESQCRPLLDTFEH